MLMIVVGVAAVDLALGRAIHAYHRGLLPGIALSGMILQLGLFRLIRGKGMVRAFWAGYVVGGALAITSLLIPGSRFWTGWYTYFLIVGDCLRILPEVSRLVRTDPPVFVVTFALIVLLPQLLLGLAGGLLALFVAWVAKDADPPPSLPI
jgi:hypothetical protein